MPILSRQELYDLVWSTPMQKLAEGFGISDVGLAKICDRHRVPTPPRGYWAKKEAGKAVSSKSVERIIGFLDRLARGCDARGMRLVPKVRQMAVVVDREDVTFEIMEKTKQVPHVLTAAEIAVEDKRRKRNEQLARGRPYWSDAIDFSPLPPNFDSVRTGQFGLRVFGWGDGLRWTWNDGKTQTLETLLDEIVDGFEAHIANARIHREQQEHAEAERRELERRRGLAKARLDRESERKRLLSRLIRAKRRIAQLNEWIHAYETATDSDLERMVEWARSELTTLESKLDPNIVAVELSTRKLFPEVDELLDPLGEPPPVRYW